jgi:hypothetical protein
LLADGVISPESRTRRRNGIGSWNFVGLVASALTSGNPHGGSFTTIIPVAVATNFPFYLAISYAALAFWSKVSKPKQ